MAGIDHHQRARGVLRPFDLRQADFLARVGQFDPDRHRRAPAPGPAASGRAHRARPSARPGPGTATGAANAAPSRRRLMVYHWTTDKRNLPFFAKRLPPSAAGCYLPRTGAGLPLGDLPAPLPPKLLAPPPESLPAAAPDNCRIFLRERPAAYRLMPKMRSHCPDRPPQPQGCAAMSPAVAALHPAPRSGAAQSPIPQTRSASPGALCVPANSHFPAIATARPVFTHMCAPPPLQS